MTSFGYMSVKRKKVEGDEAAKPVFVDERRITWRDTGLVKGKDRTGALAPFTVVDGANPLKDIRLAIEAKKKGVTTPARRPQKASARTNSNEKVEANA
jgi:hypothetical protein